MTRDIEKLREMARKTIADPMREDSRIARELLAALEVVDGVYADGPTMSAPHVKDAMKRWIDGEEEK